MLSKVSRRMFSSSGVKPPKKKFRVLKALGLAYGTSCLAFMAGAYVYTDGALTPNRLAVSWVRSGRISLMACRMAFIYQVVKPKASSLKKIGQPNTPERPG